MGRKIPIETSELVKLKEQNMSDREIAQHLKKQGIDISRDTVGYRLRKYYNEQGKVMPKKIAITADIEELVILIEQGMTIKGACAYLQEQGEKISYNAARKQVREYY